jgi:hypothetical protein
MKPEQTFDGLVASYEQTCFACPTQYEGTLCDGRWFHFHYRYGVVSLKIGDDDRVSLERGDEFAGVMNEADFKDTFVTLYKIAERQAAP